MVDKQAVVSGLITTYSDHGSGPVLVLLHGWGTDHKSFAGLSAALADTYRVICVDLPGFGGTQQPPTDWHIADYAQFVGDFLAKIGIDGDYIIGGHSFGGRVCIKAVGTGLLTPTKLMLIDSAGVRVSRSFRNQLYKAAAKVGKAITAVPPFKALQPKLRMALYKSAGSTDYLDAGTMKQIFLHTINEDLLTDAGGITVQTLLLWGEQDDATPLAQGKTLAATIPASKLQVVPNAGHYVFIDQLEQTVAIVRRFLT